MDWSLIRGRVVKDAPMKRYTSMNVGGPAKFLIYPADEEDLVAVLRGLKDEGTEVRFLGNGTNIIVSDRGVDGALIRITGMKQRRYRRSGSEVLAEVSGGASLSGFIKENAKRGFSGLERLFWIPGTVGGGVKMNAGSFGASISDRLEKMTIIDDRGDIRTVTKKKNDFGYRRSPVKTSDCVLSALFILNEKKKEEILADMEYVETERRRRHPMEYPSSGSIFKAVDGQPAWKFIEETGLKGLRIGGAAVSEKHANFIVNLGTATAVDLKELIERIKKEVYEKCGAVLEEEVEFWGYDA